MQRLLFAAGLAISLVRLQAQTPADPTVREGAFQWFALGEEMDQVERKIGPPRNVADFANSRRGWLYMIGGDGHEPTHYLVFRATDKKLVSVTRNYEPEQNVDPFFPSAESIACYMPDNPGFGIRVRRLPEGRVLLAIGAPKSGQKTGQLVLMLEADLRSQYPWVASQLAKPKTLR